MEGQPLILISVLYTNDVHESGLQITAYRHHDEAQAALYKWAREVWTNYEDDEDLDLGPQPENDEEMFARFEEKMDPDDYDWHLHDNVSL
jgi:hypothetical protein